MNKRQPSKLFLCMGILLLFALVSAFGSQIRGVVKEAQTDAKLAGANVYLAGTSIGASTNINGEYVLLRIPPGAPCLSAC